MFASKTLLALILTTALGFVASLANAAIINITPSKDNTLYQYDPADGDTSNALGLHIFAGETAMGELRRGVFAFDIAGHIPAGSTILAAQLLVVRANARILDDHDPEKKPTMWVVEPCNRPWHEQ